MEDDGWFPMLSLNGATKSDPEKSKSLGFARLFVPRTLWRTWGTRRYNLTRR
jgi:hypothetical protein